MQVEPFYRLCWEDGSIFDYVNDQAELDRQIAARNPADVAGYRRFLAYSEEVFVEGYVRLGAVPFLSFSQMVRAGPSLARLQAWRSVYGIVARFIADERLREAFSFHSLLVGGNPFATSSIYTLIHALERRWGVGSRAAAPEHWFVAWCAGSRNSAARSGSTRRSRTSRPRAAARSGSPQRTGGMASSMRWPRTPTLSTPTPICCMIIPRGGQMATTLRRKRFSMSLFVVYFGLRRHRPEIHHHTVLFGPRYRGLIDDIFQSRNAGRGFFAVPACAMRDRSVAGAAGRGQLLRAGTGAASRQCPDRLG